MLACFNYRGTSPLGRAVDSKQVLDEDWVAANIDRFVAELTAVDSATTLDEAAAERLVAEQLGVSDLHQPTDEQRETIEAAYSQLWKDPARLPVRRYRIRAPIQCSSRMSRPATARAPRPSEVEAASI